MGNLSWQVIRGYEFLKPIGSGGYGMVYEAIETAVDRRVAIKVILPQFANQPDFLANFEHEAKLVAQLEHPRIVPLYTYWRDDQGAFLVMRYIKGGSLREMLAKHGALSLAQITRIVSQIAEALQTAHESGVVHRDLKPENILIDERGNAYLTDFGIAKRADGNNTPNDTIKGSLAYLSPEQIQSQSVSAQTDIYAFGILLYEMLAGKHPFKDVPVVMMVMKHLHESLPSLRQLRPELPGDIDDIISKATAKDPTERYPNILALATNFKTVVGEGSLPAAKAVELPPRAAQQPTNPEQRNRYAMLQNVRAFWIEGVLDNSLHHAIKIDLGLQTASGVVDNPWDTLLRTPSGDTSLAADTHIVHVFERMNGKLLILGDPGSGKTTTLLELARELLLRAETDEAHPIPVVFNLSSWGEKQLPLTDWLIDELAGKYQVPRKVAMEWIQDEAILPLLDGLDEVTENARNNCVEAINTYRSEHGFVDMVVCSRIRDYEALTNQLKLNGAIIIQPLDDNQIQQYLAALGADVAVVRDLIKRDDQLRELAQSPLMLSIMILAYRGTSASNIPDFDNIEAQRQHLFEIYVRRMFERRIGDKPYSPEQTQHYLSWLGGKMRTHMISLFQIEEIQPTWLNPSQWQQYYITTVVITILLAVGVSTLGAIFLALSLRLDASLMGLLTLLTFPMAVWVFVSGRSQYWSWVLFSSGILGLCWGVGIGITYGVIAGIIATIIFTITTAVTQYANATTVTRMGFNANEIETVEKLQFTQSQANPWSLVGGLISVTCMIVIFSAVLGVHLSSANTLMGISSGSLIFGAILFWQSGLTASEVALRVMPNQAIWQTVYNAHLMALTRGFGTFLTSFLALMPNFSLFIGITAGLGFGLTSGQSYWLLYGGQSVLQHLSLRRVLFRDQLIPQNYAHFLDYAASLILLRKVGGGYIFIHRYLLEYFAGLATPEET